MKKNILNDLFFDFSVRLRGLEVSIIAEEFKKISISSAITGIVIKHIRDNRLMYNKFPITMMGLKGGRVKKK